MKRFRDWYEQIRDSILGTSGNVLTDWEKGSPERCLAEATAHAAEELGFEVDTSYRQGFAATATGVGLDLRAAEMGLKKKPAAKARGFVTFTGDAESTIPEGFKVGTGDPALDANVVEFVTLAAAEIAEGEDSVDVEVEAAVAGAAGNVAAGGITTFVDSMPAGVTGVSNASAVSGGADIEPESELQNRCSLAPYRMAVGGPPRMWESLALDVVGVARARTVSCYAGPGTFKVLVWSTDALGRLIPAGAGLLASVQALLDDYVIDGVSLVAAAPGGPIQDTTVYLEAANFETVAPLVAAAIQGLYASLVPDVRLVRAAITAAGMGCAGATNLRVAVPAEDVTPGAGETVLPGEIRVLPWEWDALQ